jgi:nucleoside-diphosphate-sugar epimerase
MLNIHYEEGMVRAPLPRIGLRNGADAPLRRRIHAGLIQSTVPIHSTKHTDEYTTTTTMIRIAQSLPFLIVAVAILVTPEKSVVALSSSVVTGANGYVGRAIVHQLLTTHQENAPNDATQQIICLVREHRVAQEENYWRNFQSSSSSSPSTSVRVLPYDMLDGGRTLGAALEECQSSDPRADNVCLYHVASVFGPTEDHRQTALQNVQGARDVVETVHRWRCQADARPPCRIVFTSSMAAVRGTGQTPANGKYYTKHDWNTVSELGANWGASYQWSKRKSEQEVRRLADLYEIPLVSLCPSFVFGPPSGGDESSSFSIQLVRRWAKGESPVQSRLLVDIRDVAKAHVLAGTSTSFTNGRLIVSTDARVASKTLADWIRDATDPRYRQFIHSDDEFTGGAIPIGEKEVGAEASLKEVLGMTLRPIQETMQDMTVKLLEYEVNQV